jgi:hypothetical protein
LEIAQEEMAQELFKIDQIAVGGWASFSEVDVATPTATSRN